MTTTSSTTETTPRRTGSRILILFFGVLGVLSALATWGAFATHGKINGGRSSGSTNAVGALHLQLDFRNDFELHWLALACSISAALLLMAVAIWSRQFSLRRLLLYTFVIAGAGMLPSLLLTEPTDTSQVRISSNSTIPALVLDRVKQRLAPDIALATLPDSMRLALGGNPAKGLTADTYAGDDGISCRLVFAWDVTKAEQLALTEFYLDYATRILDQELAAAGLPPLKLRNYSASDGIFREHARAWLEKFDPTAPELTDGTYPKDPTTAAATAQKQ